MTSASSTGHNTFSHNTLSNSTGLEHTAEKIQKNAFSFSFISVKRLWNQADATF
jgi:hypothetical protein